MSRIDIENLKSIKNKHKTEKSIAKQVENKVRLSYHHTNKESIKNLEKSHLFELHKQTMFSAFKRYLIFQSDPNYALTKEGLENSLGDI